MTIERKIEEIRNQGFCVLEGHFSNSLVEACRARFWPTMLDHLERHRSESNRGPYRYFLPMPFDPPCFATDFFFDAEILGIVRAVMDDRIVADQWGCDVPVRGSMHQELHMDYQRALFPEAAELVLPPHMLVVSFGLINITAAHGPIEICPGTNLMPRSEALRLAKIGAVQPQSMPLRLGDVLIRHPWALHRGTPNTTDVPRAMATIRYVRRWYVDNSREVSVIPRALWQSLTAEQQNLMRFPVET